MNNTNNLHDKNRKRVVIRIFAVVFALLGLTLLVFGFYQAFSDSPIFILQIIGVEQTEEAFAAASRIPYVAGFILSGAVLGFIAEGFWRYKDWARTLLNTILIAGLLFFFVQWIFGAFALIFGGKQVLSISQIVRVVGLTFWNFSLQSIGLVIGVYLMRIFRDEFVQDPSQRNLTDRIVKWILLFTALSSIFIVFLIILFTLMRAWDSIEHIGIKHMLTQLIWRPNKEIYGLVPMITGSVLATIGSVVIGVPFSIGAAILLAEIAPEGIHKIIRPAIELLAGIPSVIYGLFGMVVLAPIIRLIDVPKNTGYGLLNASIVLAIMIIPTITNITEDAIRAVPESYKKGSLGLGATRWQTIWRVIIPAARSGIVAAVILGIGRALGETMALIMVIGNSVSMPSPLTDNPLTIFLDTARTLTGNIAVEITYAAGDHRSALFFTGILLFIMIIIVNAVARLLMKERNNA